jgi:hypothetical protein
LHWAKGVKAGVGKAGILLVTLQGFGSMLSSVWCWRFLEAGTALWIKEAEQIEFPNPNEAARLDILKIHSRKMNLTRGIDLKKIADKMSGGWW